MKYLELFEDYSAEEANDKKLLDRLAMLYATKNFNLAKCEIREGTSRGEYELYVASRFGEVGFDYYDFEISDYSGEGTYDVIISYEREIGDSRYVALVQGYGKARHHEELEEVEPTHLLRIIKKS